MSAWVVLGWIYSSGAFFFGGYIVRAKLDGKYTEQIRKDMERDCFIAGYIMRGKEDIALQRKDDTNAQKGD